MNYLLKRIQDLTTKGLIPWKQVKSRWGLFFAADLGEYELEIKKHKVLWLFANFHFAVWKKTGDLSKEQIIHHEAMFLRPRRELSEMCKKARDYVKLERSEKNLLFHLYSLE